MTRLIAILSYYLGLDALFYFLNRKRKRILTFHNVLRDDIWRYSLANGVSCCEGDFRKVVKECSRWFRFSTDLCDAKTLTITFDDGYLNQYTTAFGVLKELGIPAYLFVAGDVRNGVLTVDKLLHWIAEVPAGEYEVEFNGERRRFAVSDLWSRVGFWIDWVWPKFKLDAGSRGTKLFEAFDSVYPYERIMETLSEEYRRQRFGSISDAQLDEMREQGWKIGWHTKSHYPLSQLPEAEVETELAAPDSYRSVCLSFPYGEDESVGGNALRIAERLGFPCAVSNTLVSPNNSSMFFLPRTSVSADKYLLHFELSGLKHFLKRRKLLPLLTGLDRDLEASV